LSIEITQLDTLSAPELLRWAIERFGSRFAITTSFQSEGMVLLDIAARISPNVRVITLDTGRLPEETYEIIEDVRGRYGVRVEVVAPDAAEIGPMVTRHGPNLFYESIAFRNLCCHFRKVRPLERKLAELDAWAVGLRRTQTQARESLTKAVKTDGRLKLSPLADWSSADVEEYTRKHAVPRHPLYTRGYTSIGCAPCTRAIRNGEAERAGRWWWEQDGQKECGIHYTPDGRVQRTLDVLVQEILTAPHA
jgi:phosphoadenylyl-sulfate reductase (thioredoxin)